MKLSILLAGSILTSAISGNVYAQTCGAQPSCAELIYADQYGGLYWYTFEMSI